MKAYSVSLKGCNASLKDCNALVKVIKEEEKVISASQMNTSQPQKAIFTFRKERNRFLPSYNTLM